MAAFATPDPGLGLGGGKKVSKVQDGAPAERKGCGKLAFDWTGKPSLHRNGFVGAATSEGPSWMAPGGGVPELPPEVEPPEDVLPVEGDDDVQEARTAERHTGPIEASGLTIDSW